MQPYNFFEGRRMGGEIVSLQEFYFARLLQEFISSRYRDFKSEQNLHVALHEFVFFSCSLAEYLFSLPPPLKINCSAPYLKYLRQLCIFLK